jgi:hypothetical protein
MSDISAAEGAADITTMSPPGGGQNKPSSGTYGEGAALANLEAQLPGTPSSGAAGPGAVSPPAMGPGLPPRQSAGLPSAIAAPTRRPGEQVSTPLTAQAPMPSQPSEQRMQLFRALASSPNVSETTRVWAQSVVDSFTR